MSAELASASAYLKQLAGSIKRPIQWAFLLGMVKTVVVILQLALLASLANELFSDGDSLLSQGVLLLALLITSVGRALLPRLQQVFLRKATLQATQYARQRLTQRWQLRVLSGHPMAAADGALQLEPIESLKGYVNRYLVQQYLVIASPLLVLVVCFYLSPVVGSLLLIAGPVIPLFMALVGMGAERLSQKHAQQNFALSRVFTDKLRNLTTLKLFHAGDVAVQDVAIAGEAYRKATMATLKIAFLSSAVLEFFSSVAIAGVALYVGFGLLGYIEWLGADQLTLFSGLLALLLAPEYFAPLRQFAQSYHDRAAAIGAASLLCSEPYSVKEPAKEPASDKLNAGSMLPRNAIYCWRDLQVELGAPGHSRQLAFTDDHILRGELVVISGNSGSGKTTLLKTLLRQMPFKGELAQSFNEPRQVAYFAQQPFLTAGSLRTNINLFEQHSDERILAVLRRVSLDTLVKQLPQGLDTQLSEQGVGLSGGEQRRLALARCLLSERAVLMADEPTENLDDESAAAIRRCLTHYVDAGRTVIVASHDPLLLQQAHRVIEVTS